ncbi:MAG: hypothetical protein RLN76_06450 [Phycisphaeraceae bacterium]
MTTSRPAKKRFRWGTLLIAVIALVTLAGVTLAYLASTTPEHVRHALAFIENTPKAEREQIAQNLEQRLASLFGDTHSSIDPETRQLLQGNTNASVAAFDGTGRNFRLTNNPTTTPNATTTQKTGPQKLTMTFDEINAWFCERLEQWAKNQGTKLPDFAANYLVNQVNGRLVLAFEMKTDEVSGWITLHNQLTFTPNGQATLKITQIDAGELALPRETITKQLKNYADKAGSKAQVQSVVAAFEGHAFDPIFPIDSKTNVRVTSLNVSATGLTFELQQLASK